MKLLFPLTALLLLTACPNNQEPASSIQSNDTQSKQNTATSIEVTPQENKEIQQETNKLEETMISDIFDNGFTIDDYPLLIEKNQQTRISIRL